jgi:hypothetical protein
MSAARLTGHGASSGQKVRPNRQITGKAVWPNGQPLDLRLQNQPPGKEDVAPVTASQRHSQWHMRAHLAAAPDANFVQRFVDCRVHRTSLDRGRVKPIAARMRSVRADIGAAMRPKFRNGSPLSDHREVIVTMNEYEEWFRPPTRSLHQTFAEIRGPNRRRRWVRYLWAVAALIGGLIVGAVSDDFRLFR